MNQTNDPKDKLSITLTPTKMVDDGLALGHHGGRVIFVSGAIPGEKVQAEIITDKERFAHARLVKVIQSSPDRIDPRCPHVPECGGCQWQHIAYSRQLALKTEVVRDQLTRIGSIAAPPVRPTLAAPSPWGYRNRVTFHSGKDGNLGFQKAASHDTVPIKECHIADPRLMALYDDLDLNLPGLVGLTLMAGREEDDLLIAFETERDEAPELHVDFPVSCVHLVGGTDAIPVNLIGNNHITQQVLGHAYRVSAGRFFQVNTAVAEILVELALEWLDPSPDDTILDAYCGVGLFTLPLSERAGSVIGVELDPGATEDLILNLGDIENVDVIEGTVEAVLPDLAQEETLHGVVVDPPRRGLHVAAIDALVESGPPRLVYVSCNAATLARDVKRLARGGYTLVDVQPVDMFPQTYHVETVALLKR